jgi:hypothetical protein
VGGGNGKKAQALGLYQHAHRWPQHDIKKLPDDIKKVSRFGAAPHRLAW